MSEHYNPAEKPGAFFAKLPVLASTSLLAGDLVTVSAAGYAKKPASTSGSAGEVMAGVAQEDVDNASGSSGDLEVLVKRGVYKIPVSDTDPPTLVNVGRPVYAEDEGTVSTGANTEVVAGILLGFDADGDAYVDVGAAPVAEPFTVLAAGIHAWAGGAATTDSIAVVGLAATDVVQATLVARAATETLVMAANDAGNDQIDLTLSAAGTDTTTKVAYCVLRPRG